MRDVDTGEDLPDHLRWVKFSQAAWTHDGQGFFYSRYDKPQAGRPLKEANFFQKLYYHRLGTPQSEDELIHLAKDKLGGVKAPKSVDFIEALPRNASGKILRRHLRDPYWAGKDRQVN